MEKKINLVCFGHFLIQNLKKYGKKRDKNFSYFYSWFYFKVFLGYKKNIISPDEKESAGYSRLTISRVDP